MVETKRLQIRVSDDVYKQVQYWAARNEMSVSEYVLEAIGLAIRHENKDYNLPSLEINRLNQIVDGFAVLSSNVEQLEKVVTHGFDSLLGLTRGDSYLSDLDLDSEV